VRSEEAVPNAAALGWLTTSHETCAEASSQSSTESWIFAMSARDLRAHAKADGRDHVGEVGRVDLGRLERQLEEDQHRPIVAEGSCIPDTARTRKGKMASSLLAQFGSSASCIENQGRVKVRFDCGE